MSTHDDSAQAGSQASSDSSMDHAVLIAERDALREQVAQLEKELEEVRSGALESQELQRFKDLAARAQADLQNAKARVERESQDLRKFATEQMIVRILPTLDNFQRAFQQIPTELASHEWVKGVAAIEQNLMKQMADAGLQRMQSLGQVADPAKHEILTAGPGEADKVTEVFEEGYELHGKVLRPAKVKVGTGE